MSEEKTPGRIPRVDDDEILDVFRVADDPVLSTSGVADALPIKHRGTQKRLTALAEDGVLERKQIAKVVVWWLPGFTDTSRKNESPGEGS